MKRLVLMILSMGLCFAELSVDTQEKKFDVGFFVGGGIGIGANAMQYNNVSNSSGGLYEQNQSFASFVASVKVGAYHYFTPTLGLRAYYNLDLNVLPLDEYGTAEGTFTPYVLSTSHTINADVIYNVFSHNNIDVAVIGGMGLGALAGESMAKSGSVYYKNSSIGDGFLDFEFRLNIGARAMLSKKYGVEFMAKIPVTPATMIIKDGNKNIKYSPYYFTIDFVMEKF